MESWHGQSQMALCLPEPLLQTLMTSSGLGRHALVRGTPVTFVCILHWHPTNQGPYLIQSALFGPAVPLSPTTWN